MNPDIKQRWVAALRSGEYEQGKHALRTEDNKFCCLGVLCELAVQDGIIGPPELRPNPFVEADVRMYGYGANRRFGVLPEEVSKWADVADDPKVRTVSIGFGAFGSKLSILNDNGIPFDTIADYIEADL